MIALIILLVMMFGILCFRIYRTVYYYNEVYHNPDAEERSVARTNLIIHIVVCVLLALSIAMALYWFIF
jgi:formate hydrogenlyase subunit 3/multisubunit Na+/H+ antiporter MnhD subunit